MRPVGIDPGLEPDPGIDIVLADWSSRTLSAGSAICARGTPKGPGVQDRGDSAVAGFEVAPVPPPSSQACAVDGNRPPMWQGRFAAPFVVRAQNAHLHHSQIKEETKNALPCR